MKKSLSTIRFTTTGTIRANGSLVIVMPKSTKLPKSNTLNIEGVINTLPFQSVLKANPLAGGGAHILTLDQELCALARINGSVTVEITRVGDEAETRVPVELTRALAATPKAHTLWNDITPIARRDWIFWIITGRKAETRDVRITTACSKLSSGMRRVCCFGGISWLMKTAKEKGKTK